MTTSLTANVNHEAAAPLPQPRSQAPVISAAGVSDVAAVARQQLPSAVPAPALIAAYTSQVVTPPTKPAPRSGSSSQPSSALAAQLLVQDPEATSDTFEIFAPRTTPPLTPREDEFVAPKVNDGEPQPREATQNAPRATQRDAPEAPPQLATTLLSYASSIKIVPTLVTYLAPAGPFIQATGYEAYHVASARIAGRR